MISARSSPRVVALCHGVSLLANIIVLAIGGLALLWWLTGWNLLSAIFPSIVYMHANAALAFVLAGLSLWLVRAGKNVGAQVTGGLVLGLGLVTALEHILHRDLQIDILVQGSASSGRMAQATSFEFFAVGFSLFLVACKSPRAQWLAHFCVFIVASIAALAVVGFVFGIQTMEQMIARSTGFYNGLALLFLCCGIVLARPDAGLMRILTADHASSTMAIRLLAGTIFLPIGLGWICMAGARAGFYAAPVGMALLAILSIFFLTILVWLNLQAVHRKQAMETYLASIIESTDEAIVGVSCEGVITTWNAGAERLYGFLAAEVIGRSPAMVVPADRQEDITHIPGKLKRGERVDQYETVRLRKDGKRIEVSLSAAPVKDQHDRVIGFAGVVRDISARKRSERRTAAFSKLGQRLSSTVTEKEAVKIIFDTADEILGWDAAFFDLYFPEQDEVFCVLAVDEVNGKRTETAPSVLARTPSHIVRTTIKHGAQLILRDEASLSDGKLLPFGSDRLSASLMFVVVQNLGRVIGILSIQSYKSNAYNEEDLQTLQALADHCAGAMERIRADQRYHAIFENTAIGLFQFLPNRRLTLANVPFARQAGYASPDELLGRVKDVAADLFVEPERYEILCRLLDETEMARGFQAQIRRKDGTRIWVSLNVYAVKNERGEVFYFEGSAEDVTERRKAEHELLLLAQALRSTNDCVCVTDLDDKFVFVNEAFLRTYGFEADELLGQSVSVVRPTDAFLEQEEILVAALRGGWHGEVLNKRKNGEIFPISLSAGLIRDEQGRPVALIGVAEDITERKRAENALANERNLLRTLIDNLPVCIFIKDLNGRFVLNNRTHLEFLGVTSPDGVEGKTVGDLFPRETADTMVESDREVLQSGRAMTVEQTLHDAGGRERFFSTTKVPLRDAAGKISALVCFSQDITERLNLEAQLRQTQKMESIGLLAGGIAHDFNNIITLIQGYAAVLRDGSESQETVTEAAHQISTAAERASNLTGQLLLFSRRQIMQPRNLDLNEVISGMVKMLRRVLREDIVLQVNYAPALPLIRADRGMMEQVILNLSVNARDAMPQGGQLNVSSILREFDAGQLPQNSEARPGSFVCLEVADTGCGIPPEILPRIFEPFFTTKGIGKGTGLGLATVYGIVKQHEGWIDFTSELGKGTSFRIYLPARPELIPAAQKTAAPEPVRGGRETIFVVEDEEPVRKLVRGVLERYGYSVVEAPSGAAALDIWRERKNEIHLLLSDIVMPDGISGRHLAEKLRADNPALKVVFTSGYSFEIAGQDFVLADGAKFLQKPYEPWKLAQTVRQALDKS